MADLIPFESGWALMLERRAAAGASDSELRLLVEASSRSRGWPGMKEEIRRRASSGVEPAQKLARLLPEDPKPKTQYFKPDGRVQILRFDP